MEKSFCYCFFVLCCLFVLIFGDPLFALSSHLSVEKNLMETLFYVLSSIQCNMYQQMQALVPFHLLLSKSNNLIDHSNLVLNYNIEKSK